MIRSRIQFGPADMGRILVGIGCVVDDRMDFLGTISELRDAEQLQ